MQVNQEPAVSGVMANVTEPDDDLQGTKMTNDHACIVKVVQPVVWNQTPR